MTNRLTDIHEQDATGKAADISAGIKKAISRVPNVYLIIGGHLSVALQRVLAHNVMLYKGSLNAQQLEVINLSISGATGCDYCLVAHTLMAEKAGFSGEQIRTLRHGEYAGEMQLNTLVKLAQILVTTAGTLPEVGVVALRNAGFSDQQVIGTIGAISTILFTNMANRANDTMVDLPKAD